MKNVRGKSGLKLIIACLVCVMLALVGIAILNKPAPLKQEQGLNIVASQEVSELSGQEIIGELVDQEDIGDYVVESEITQEEVGTITYLDESLSVQPSPPSDVGASDDPSPGESIIRSLGEYRWRIEFSDWNSNKWDVSSIKISCSLPSTTQITRTTTGFRVPSWCQYFSYSIKTVYSEERIETPLGDILINAKYTYYAVPSGPKDSGTYSASPGGSITVKSYSRPDFDWSYEIKSSTLTLYGNGATKKYTAKYGSTRTLSIDSVGTNSYGATTMRGTNSYGFTKNGYYLDDWSVSCGADAEYDDDTRKFTYGGTDSSGSAGWSARKYAIVFLNAQGKTVDHTITTYKSSIYGIPSMPVKPGYRGAFYLNNSYVIHNGDIFYEYVNDTYYAYWKEVPITYPITWNGLGGTFADGTTVKTTYTTFDQNYQMPPEITRPGYRFLGWYTAETGGYLVDSKTQMTNVNFVNMYAHWEIKNDLEVIFKTDDKVIGFDLKIEDTFNNKTTITTWADLKEFSHLSNIFGCTDFTLSNLEFVEGWTFHKLSITSKETGNQAEKGVDYDLTEGEEGLTLRAYSSIEILVVSCVKIYVEAVSNFSGTYTINNDGGQVAIGDEDFKNKTSSVVPFQETVTLNAQKTGIKVEFLGWYSAFSPSGVSEENLLSAPGALTTESIPIESTITVYAVFKFNLYTITIKSYTDDKNFVESQALDETATSDAGGSVGLKPTADKNSPYNYSKVSSILLADGYSYSYSAYVKTIAQPNVKYVFIGLYTDFSLMKSDTANIKADPMKQVGEFVVEGRDVTYYAKFVKQYEFIAKATKGITNISVGADSGVARASEYYYYNQEIGAISCIVDHSRYMLSTPAWTLDQGSLRGYSGVLSLEDQEYFLSLGKITSGLYMPAEPVVITSCTEGKFFDLKIYVIYTEKEIYNYANRGGIGAVQSTNPNDIIYSDDGGQTLTKFQTTVKVRYGSDAISLVATPKDSGSDIYQYVFVGWYSFFGGLYINDSYFISKEKEFKIDYVGDTLRYFCAFAKASYVEVSSDDRIDSVEFNDTECYEADVPEGQKLFYTYMTYNQLVSFEVKLERGVIDSFKQTQTDPDVDITFNETKTIYSFVMPTYPVRIHIITKAERVYLLMLRAFVVDNLQGSYDTDAGFDSEAGTIQLKEADTIGTTLKFQAEEASVRTLVATEGIGYTFFGWYKLKTDVSYSNLIKEGAPNYRSNIESWFNLYDKDLNPNGSYTFFSADNEVVSDPIDRIDKNLYVAVFVKNYSLLLTAGDKGISEITYESSSNYDRNGDGEIDKTNETHEVYGSLQTITAPYGTHFDVLTSVLENYTFMCFEIVSGATSLGHYQIVNGQILPSEVDPNDSLRLEFYLYDNIQIIARTVTEFRQLTVNIFTLDVEGNEVLSMEGGTFNFASEQSQVFDMIIGASLVGFVQVNRGFVFKGFKHGENFVTNMAMPAENASIDVIFERNAYILETHITSIGYDGIPKYDDQTGGQVEAGHSVLFGDTGLLNLTASVGYVLKGIYLDQDCKVLAPDFESQKQASETLNGYIFSYEYRTAKVTEVPETPKTPVFKFYIVFELKLFDISKTNQETELNSGETNELSHFDYTLLDAQTFVELSDGYFGEEISISLPENFELRYYNAYSLKIFDVTNNEEVKIYREIGGVAVEASSTEFGCLQNGFTYYFIMPIGDIQITFECSYYQMQIVFDAITNTGTFENQYVMPDENKQVKATVFYNFNNFEPVSKSTLIENVFDSNIPYATKIGFKLVSYNTSADGSGINFVTYEYDQLDNLTKVNITDFVFISHPTDFSLPITLYAIYDYANIDTVVSYAQGAEVEYNGKLQQMLQAEVFNFNAEIPYVFTWFAPNGDKVGSYHLHNDQVLDQDDNIAPENFYVQKYPQNSITTSALWLRSSSQSGYYTCLISIDDVSSNITAEDTRIISILRAPLGIYLDNSQIYYGQTVFAINSGNTYGLLPVHNISGTMVMETEGDYSETNPPLYEFEIANSLTLETQQDGTPIKSNYSPYFIGTCTVKNPVGIVSVKAGAYLRTVDSFLNETYNTSPETNIIVYNVSYSGFEADSQRIVMGITTNYIKDQALLFGDRIYLSYDFVYGFEFYEVYVNNRLVSQDITQDATTISFPFLYEYVENGVVDIKVYLTQDCLVTANFNANGITQEFMQKFNEPFTPPSPPQKEGYVLEGWYFDSSLTQKVGEVWQKTGKVEIFAKWEIETVTAKLVLTDAGIEKDITSGKYQKTFDADNISLGYKLSLSGFTSQAKWFKVNNLGSWVEVSGVENLSNVSESGMYSVEILITGDAGQQQTVLLGELVIEIEILPYGLMLDENLLDKVYDGKTSCGEAVFVDGFVGTLGLSGKYQDKNVLRDENGNILTKQVFDLKLLDNGQEHAENYVILNTEYYGKILPLEVELFASATKVYDGTIYEGNFSQYSTANELIRFTVKTSGSDAGHYADKQLLITPTFVASSENNYTFTVADSALVVIEKAEHYFVFASETVYYNGENHSIVVKHLGAEVTELTDGVISVSYSYNGIVASSAKNAGVYVVDVVIKGDQNYNDWLSSAILTIKKAQFTVSYTLNNQPLPMSKIYNGEDDYSYLKAHADIANNLTTELDLKLVASKDEQTVNEVKNAGVYKLDVTYNLTNFEVIGTRSAYYKIEAEKILVESLFKGKLEYTYNSQDFLNLAVTQALKDEYKDVVTISSQSVAKKDPTTQFYATQANRQVVNVGDYQIYVNVAFKMGSGFVSSSGQETTTGIIDVTINKFVLTDFTSLSISKTYDDNVKFNNGTMTVNLGTVDAPISKTETFSGEFASADAGENIKISKIALSNRDNYEISEGFVDKLYGTISQKEISVKLLQADNTFVTALYQNPYTFTINAGQNQGYVFGLVSGQLLEANIVCVSTNENKRFPLSSTSQTNVAYLDFSSASVMSGKISNYKLGTLEGGILLVDATEIVVKVVDDNNAYTGEEKDIYVSFNEILCVYDKSAGIFKGVNNNAPEEISIVNYVAPVDAKEYVFTLAMKQDSLFSFVGGTLNNNQSFIDVVYKIDKAPIATVLNLNAEYSDVIESQSGSIRSNLNPNHIVSYQLNLEGIDTKVLGESEITLNQIENSDILTITSTEEYKNNYNVSIIVKLLITQKKLNVSTISGYEDLTYTGFNQIANVQKDLVFTDVLGNNYTQISASDYSIKYYYGNLETTEIINVGGYRAVIYADNFVFENNGEYLPYKTLGEFAVNKAVLSGEFVGQNVITYNASFQTPLSARFTFNNQPVLDVEYSITFAKEDVSYPLGVRDVGQYTATLTARSDTFDFTAITQTITVNPYVFTITPPSENEVWFSKYYGESDPSPMTKTFVTDLNETLNIKFARAMGEQVGKYALINAELVTENPNYTLIFNDVNKGFYILSYEDVGGVITVKLTQNILKVYDALPLTEINLLDYPDLYEMVDVNNIAPNPNFYDIKGIYLGFSESVALGVGYYNLVISSIDSSTHAFDQIVFMSQGYKFIINPKPISVIPQKISKVYDGLTSVVLDSSALNGVCEADKTKISLAGEFDTKNVGENKTVTLLLTGEGVENYEFENPLTSGSITAKPITVTGNFNKTYDGNNLVQIENLIITGVVNGETLAITGNYADKNVGENKAITFTLADNNYVLENTTFQGNIVVRKLEFDKSKSYDKQFDGTVIANVTIDDILGIVQGDDVSITSASYVEIDSQVPSSTVGEKFLLVVLGGQDKLNYELKPLLTEIKTRILEIVYHYGDDESYIVNFVSDGKTIENKRQSQEVRYGQAVKYLGNAVSDLSSPTRIGYNFVKWTLDKEGVLEFTEATNTGTVNIQNLIDNNWKIHLYAHWEIKQYKVWLVSETEDVNGTFIESSIGGKIQVFDNSKLLVGEILCTYFETYDVSIVTNPHFEFVKLMQNDSLASLTQETQISVNQETTLTAVFKREMITLSLNVQDFNVSGYNTEIWHYENSSLVTTKRYGTFVKLPILNTYGYDFVGYYDENDSLISGGIQFELEQTQVLDAVFNAKKVLIKVQTSGGEGDENYPYYEELPAITAQDKFIQVTYGEAFGELPSITKAGYVFEGFNLENQGKVLENITAESTLKFAETTLTLNVVWGKAQNKFVIGEKLDQTLYEQNLITAFEVYESGLDAYYNNGESNLYVKANNFTVGTESVVKLKVVNQNPFVYDFAYWEINGEKLETTLSTLNTTFELCDDFSGTYLKITGFTWGETNPTINMVFAPKSHNVVVNEYDSKRGKLEEVSGTFIENDTLKTLTGAEVKFVYTENLGYTLNKQKTYAENATIAFIDNNIVLSGIKTDVALTPVFEKNKLYFSVNKAEGVAFVKYAVNDSSLTDYVVRASLVTEDVLKLEVGVKYGYDLTLSISENQIQVIENITVQDQFTVYSYEITNFTSDFVITLLTEKQTFTLSASQKLFVELTNEYLDITEHSTQILNASGEEISRAQYLERVIFSASVNPVQIQTANNETLSVIEYEFIGWYSNKINEMILLTSQKNYAFDVVTNTEYFAVFKPVVYTVEFTSDEKCGTIVNLEGKLTSSSENVVAGENLRNSYTYKAEAGYKFVGWEVVYSYLDENSTTVISEVQELNFGAIHANIVATAKFEKRNITVSLNVNRPDQTALDNDTLVQIGEETGFALEVQDAKTRTVYTLKAISQNAYQFIGFEVSGVPFDAYIISAFTTTETEILDPETKTPTGEVIVVDSIEIEFISDDITNFTVFANFELKDVEVSVSFVSQNVTVVETGVVEDQSGKASGNVQTFTAQAKSSIVCYVNIYKGFKLTDGELKYITNKQNITVLLEDETESLSIDKKQIFAQRIKVTISGFTSNAEIEILGQGQKILINFASLTNFFENTYTENSYTGFVDYYGTKIFADETAPENALTPKFENCIFLGWSLTPNQNNMVTDQEGELLSEYWTLLSDEISLYPIYRYANVRVEVDVAPLSALVNPYTYQNEVFKNHSMINMNTGAGYYFDIGEWFGLEIPLLKPQYHFNSFTYYKVNSENKIEQVEIIPDLMQNFTSMKPFVAENLKDYEYSLASNFEDYSHLVDSVMYITIVCNMDIDFYAENYFTENRVADIGGEVEVLNLSNNLVGVYNREIILKATPQDGYMVKEWWVNNTKLDTTTETLSYTLEEPSVFVVKFIGKQVLIDFNLTENGKVANLVGGNGELTENGHIRHVGDIVYLTAEAKEGYNFTSAWRHSSGQEFVGQQYTISSSDGKLGMITFTPIITERNLQVYITLPYGYGEVLKNGKELMSSHNFTQIKYVYSLPYFSALELEIEPIKRYKIKSIMLEANSSTTDITDYCLANRLTITNLLYNNASILNITVEFEKMYWLSLIQEANLIQGEGKTAVLTTDFAGSGKKDDPYKITTVYDLVKLAYVINEGLTQRDTALKNSYNGLTTYYEIVLNIDLEDRFWTPIGTKNNPFNSTITIYHMPTNILVDNADPYYDNSLFDQKVLKDYGGLFGYLGLSANIIFKISSHHILIIAGIAIILVVLLVVITIVVVHKARQKSLKKFDEDNNFLFDKE